MWVGFVVEIMRRALIWCAFISAVAALGAVAFFAVYPAVDKALGELWAKDAHEHAKSELASMGFSVAGAACFERKGEDSETNVGRRKVDWTLVDLAKNEVAKVRFNEADGAVSLLLAQFAANGSVVLRPRLDDRILFSEFTDGVVVAVGQALAVSVVQTPAFKQWAVKWARDLLQDCRGKRGFVPGARAG